MSCMLLVRHHTEYLSRHKGTTQNIYPARKAQHRNAHAVMMKMK